MTDVRNLCNQKGIEASKRQVQRLMGFPHPAYDLDTVDSHSFSGKTLFAFILINFSSTTSLTKSGTLNPSSSISFLASSET